MKGLTPRPSYGEIVSLAFNLRMKYYRVTIQMKPLQQYFHMVRVVPTFESADEVLTCYHSNETLLAERFPNVFMVIFFFRDFTERNFNVFVNVFLGHLLIGVKRANLSGDKLREH